MPNSPNEALNLPVGDDPVGDNPFSVSDPKRRCWEDATQEAEENAHRLNSERLKKCSDNPAASALDCFVGKFNAWAKRGCSVIWSTEDVRPYDHWLESYANAWIKTVEEWHPADLSGQDLIPELRFRLLQSIEHWKYQARKFARVLQQAKADQHGGKSGTEAVKPAAEQNGPGGTPAIPKRGGSDDQGAAPGAEEPGSEGIERAEDRRAVGRPAFADLNSFVVKVILDKVGPGWRNRIDMSGR
jgi:hypothetical protein